MFEDGPLSIVLYFLEVQLCCVLIYIETFYLYLRVWHPQNKMCNIWLWRVLRC